MFKQDVDSVPDVAALRMREATIAAGIWLTLGIGALGEIYVAFTSQRAHRTELILLFALAIVGAILVWLLLRERIVLSRWREPFFLSWTFLDFGMLVLAFFIPVVFSAMPYPLGSVVAVGVLSVISCLTLAFSRPRSSRISRPRRPSPSACVPLAAKSRSMISALATSSRSPWTSSSST